MNDDNEYLGPWLSAAAQTPGLTTDALKVSAALSECIIGISVRVFTDWRKLNVRLGRWPGDKAVVSALAELQDARLLARPNPTTANGYGYRITLPTDPLMVKPNAKPEAKASTVTPKSSAPPRCRGKLVEPKPKGVGT